MSFIEMWLIAAALIAVGAVGMWILSLVLRDSSIVDIAWGAGFALVALASALAGDGYAWRQLLVAVLAGAWGLRLAGYIWWRNRGHGEDQRYQSMRASAGRRWWWQSFFQVFLLQGLLMWLIAAPLVAAASIGEPDALTVWDGLGVLVWCAGFAFESIGDYQLARFKSDPANRGRVMRSGLWAYTRHPNYFGDATLWWGFYLIAVSVDGGFWTFGSPLLMTFLLVRVSGVALLERSQKRSKPEYASYIQSTSAFIPWFPKRNTAGREPTASA